MNKDVFNNQTRNFCTGCGAKLVDGSRFCGECGKDMAAVIPPPPKTNVPYSGAPFAAKEGTPARPTYVNAGTKYNAPKRKSPVALIILIAILIIGALIAVLVLSNKDKDKDAGTTPKQTTAGSKTTSAGKSDSAVVSLGVQSSDLGNIMNGQYYFATDKNIFYSSFDENDKAHIYSAKKDGTSRKAIFDGFGWSLVVIEDWLYFSGNQGDAIDGTYNIFRIKLDGSQVERLNNEYSYGMFLYGSYLYYMKRNPDDQTTMSTCRSSLDGKNEEELFPDGLSPIIYKNKLYYHDKHGNMYATEPDGKNPKVLLTAAVKTYVLSNEKIIYNSFSDEIYTCDLDGSNNKLIRSSKGVPINSVNAYNGRIFFSEYDENFNYTVYGYNYTIKSCKMDGSDERSVYSSTSYGIYMNLVDNKLMLMDYAMNPSSNIMHAVIKSMELDGSNVGVLPR